MTSPRAPGINMTYTYKQMKQLHTYNKEIIKKRKRQVKHVVMEYNLDWHKAINQLTNKWECI